MSRIQAVIGRVLLWFIVAAVNEYARRDESGPIVNGAEWGRVLDEHQQELEAFRESAA